jgi:hypothetical protein
MAPDISRFLNKLRKTRKNMAQRPNIGVPSDHSQHSDHVDPRDQRLSNPTDLNSITKSTDSASALNQPHLTKLE